ncbi:DUF3592 domain-containing protein [Viridibacterium curvum]|uniref:DUF3592 domain-containing protein n=1 Tax=Viridibacterium curvum TaxID=1101404 RepID=A0ABP9QNF1_9RHOO
MPSAVVIGIFVVIIGAGIAVFAMFFMPDFLRRGAQENLRDGQGVMAPAQIVSIADTGRRYASNPVVRFTLTVSPVGQAAFPLILEQEISMVQMGQFVPGRTLQIRYNPDKLTQAVIVGP